MTTVAMIGTFDTKAAEYAWLAQEIERLGCNHVGIDCGSFSTSDLADVTADDVIREAGEDPAALRARRDRGEMMTVMGAGAAAVVQRMAQRGEIHGVLAVGGSGGSSVAAPAMQALPIGFPKMLVSTMASGNIQPYVGSADVTVMHSVVDISGINSISATVMGNAVAGIVSMAQAFESRQDALPQEDARPVVGLSMFGLTTPAADEARQRLADLGYEVLVFHATGTGGRAMEKLVESGMIHAVCDLTTTELADDLVGGVLSAGPERLEPAGRAGIPQAVSLGALDMVNFGPRESVPERFEQRRFVVHNPTVTLMRTTAKECRQLGERIARKLCASTGPTDLFIPLRGLSGIDVPDGPFHDPDADRELFDALRKGLEGSAVAMHELDQNINSEGFGRAMADALHTRIAAGATDKSPGARPR